MDLQEQTLWMVRVVTMGVMSGKGIARAWHGLGQSNLIADLPTLQVRMATQNTRYMAQGKSLYISLK